MLLGREEEFCKFEALLTPALSTKTAEPLSIYVGGTPGTGKTATVRLVIEKLLKSRLKFDFVSIDCFECSTAADLYRKILNQLNNTKPVSNSRISAHLENVLNEASRPIVILLDEIDRLSNSKTDVLIYKVFTWPAKTAGNVILIGISNALDLVERMLPKLKANAYPPKVVTYSPYTKQQLLNILKQKLANEGIDNTAIELCARKVSALTGDVRRAFHIANGLINSLRDSTENAENYLSGKNEELTSDLQNHLCEANECFKNPLNSNLTVTLHSPKKKNVCREVLKEIDKVYASPLLRAQLPLHPKILLATFMRLISSNTVTKSKRINMAVVSRDKLFIAYAKVCSSLSYGALNPEELGNAFAVLESQGMISSKAKGRVAFEVEMEIARKIINDNAILSAIENVDLT